MSAPRSRCSQQRGNCLEVSQTGERHDRKRAAQMPGCGRRGKPKPGFPSPPTSPWKSLSRFPHCRSPGHDRHGKVEIQKQDSHFATAPSLSLSNQKTKGDQPQPKTLSFRLISGLEYAPPGPVPISRLRNADPSHVQETRYLSKCVAVPGESSATRVYARRSPFGLVAFVI